jgi:hypothetical protein
MTTKLSYFCELFIIPCRFSHYFGFNELVCLIRLLSLFLVKGGKVSRTSEGICLIDQDGRNNLLISKEHAHSLSSAPKSLWDHFVEVQYTKTFPLPCSLMLYILLCITCCSHILTLGIFIFCSVISIVLRWRDAYLE